MGKGFVHLVPIIAIAVVVGVASVGVAGTVRSSTISTNSVLASSDSGRGGEMSQANKTKEKENSGKDSNSQNTVSQSDKKAESPAVDKSSRQGGKENVNVQKEVGDSMKLKVGGENEASDGAEPEATQSVRPGAKIRTNFPININPETNEKTVTTPGGVKTIVLPEVAIQNMIKAGFPVVLSDDTEEGTPSATPEGTPSGATESGDLDVDTEADILLTEIDGKLVYEIPATKDEQFLGVLDLKIKVKGIVSAENGEIIKIQKSVFDAILDFFSF